MRHAALFRMVIGGLALLFAPATSAAEGGTLGQVNAARPFEPPTRPAFIPLPPGAVEPAGWLRDWCQAGGMVIPGTWTSIATSSNGPGLPTIR